MRYFSTTGECFPDRRCMVPPEPRLPDARRYIDRGQYFVVHASRQTGKTTTISSLAQTLTSEGRYAAVYASFGGGRALGDDYAEVQRHILADLAARAESPASRAAAAAVAGRPTSHTAWCSAGCATSATTSGWPAVAHPGWVG